MARFIQTAFGLCGFVLLVSNLHWTYVIYIGRVSMGSWAASRETPATRRTGAATARLAGDEDALDVKRPDNVGAMQTLADPCHHYH